MWDQTSSSRRREKGKNKTNTANAPNGQLKTVKTFVVSRLSIYCLLFLLVGLSKVGLLLLNKIKIVNLLQ